MSTELATLAEQVEYAKLIAKAGLLPDAYRNKPENVLVAVGLGQAMGLSPAESLYRITVIQGKPTASAELIAANVRKAGHKLRITGTDDSATATIIRSDDTDYEFSVTRDTAWAKQMGLLGKDNYKKQPGTMLQWRAITAVARLACPEALYGVVYSAEELTDHGPVAGERPARVTAADILALTPSPERDGTDAPADPESSPEDDSAPVDAEVVPDAEEIAAKVLDCATQADVQTLVEAATTAGVIGDECTAPDGSRTVLADLLRGRWRELPECPAAGGFLSYLSGTIAAWGNRKSRRLLLPAAQA